MLTTVLNAHEFREMVAFVATRIIEKEAYLNSLDAALGDGDHGITMRLGFEAIARRFHEVNSDADLEQLLVEAGRIFLSATGGAIGVVMGKMMTAAGRALKSQPRLGPAQLKGALAAMESAVSVSGKVKIGDKTILDAISGAGQAVSGNEASLHDALGKAADAAEVSAQNTATMVCRVGRASRLGDRTLGHPDPGAVSFALMLRAMADWAGAERTLIADT